MIWSFFVFSLAASIVPGLKWLRVAQREHYIAGSCRRFLDLWMRHAVWVEWIALLGVFSLLFPASRLTWVGFVAVAIAASVPWRLSLRGRSSSLAWTPRLIRVAATTGALVVAGLSMAAFTESPVAMILVVLLLPFIVDLALFILQPIERALGRKWVEQAKRKLSAVEPEVVALTGSYGKTTTKGYTAHLLSGTKRVLPTPASFNNRMGLARAINEKLTPDTQLFIAEMGTYGKGEISDMCSWVTPKVAAIISIGPVHLERFRTEDRIVEAKSEILDRADIGVICVDHPLLARLADQRATSMSIIEVGTGDRGQVIARDGTVQVDGLPIGAYPDGVYPANLAVAVGVGLALGHSPAEMSPRFADLPRSEHRLTISTSPSGRFTIIDDTFNSNPEGARYALRELASSGEGRKVVVTPGMVELGRIQAEENEQLAAIASQLADDILIVGRTNRAALELGSAKGRAAVTVVANREEAVEWVRSNLGPGDTVLYENDLPDHYP